MKTILKNKKIGIVAIAVILASVCVSLDNSFVTALEQEFRKGEGTQMIADISRMSPEAASERGIHGYLKITCEEVPRDITIRKGSRMDIPITLEYVNFDESLPEIMVNIDPLNEYGLFIEQLLGKDKPSVLLNSLVDFDVKGNIEIEAGQQIIVKATVSIPNDSLTYSIPFGGIGISTDDVGMCDKIEVRIHVE